MNERVFMKNKIRKITYYVLTFFLAALSGCAGESIKVSTFPDKVTVSIEESNGQIIDLGESPIELETEDVFQSGNIANIILSKEGYQSERLYLSKSDIPTEVSISQKLKRENSNNQSILNSKTINDVAAKIAEAQRNSFKKNFVKAELLLKQVLEDFPELGVGHDLLANIYYLTNAKSKALFHYKRAKQLSDNSVKRDQMINLIEKEL